MSEALIFASTNPLYDDRFFIELQVQYMKIPSSSLGRTCCVQKLFLTSRHLTFLNTTCSIHVLKKEELLTKIYLYSLAHNGRPLAVVAGSWSGSGLNTAEILDFTIPGSTWLSSKNPFITYETPITFEVSFQVNLFLKQSCA